MGHLLHDPEFWVLVAGIVFVAVAWKPARNAIVGSLDQRAAAIRAELDEARKLRDDAQALLTEYQNRQRAADGEAEAIIAHAREEAERIAAEAARDLEHTLARRKTLAEERIAQAEARALGEIRAAAVDIAIVASRQVITGELDERRGAVLIDQAIASLPQGLN